MSARILFVAALALAGCKKGKKDGPSCDDAGKQYAANLHLAVGEAQRDGKTDAEGRQLIDDHVPAMRDMMVRACKEHHWPAETRKCFAEAADGAAEDACYEAMPAELRAKLDESASPKKPD